MSSCANAQSTEVGCVSEHDALPEITNSPREPVDEEEEDEEEDVDFNPFLKETLSPEASSSLSSEIVGDYELGEEEITTQTNGSLEGTYEKETECTNDVRRKTRKRKSVFLSQSEGETLREKENGSASSGMDVNDGMVGELGITAHSTKPVMDSDDGDAICRRTRARYSLASFTLDELEVFLQETDDDDDLQNVDDEEEYRKFLAAVLQGGDGDDLSTQVNENIDDEDEDNDADFEIELEEMLESDYDEVAADKAKKEEFVRAARRPETRQNKRQKAFAQYKKKLLEQSKRPLRPLLPILPNGQPAHFPRLDGKNLTPETASSCPTSTTKDALVNGFTPPQIGQLYCLIHEHVQLLIQVFSLCIVDPSRQHIASQVQGLIFEMLNKRDEVVARRSDPYPAICFSPPYICSSVPDTLPQFCVPGSTPESSTLIDSPGHVLNGQVGNVQAVEGSFWVPSISGSVISVLDVAPLNLAGSYMDDVYTAVRENRRRHMECGYDFRFESEPMFPFPCLPSSGETNDEVLRGRVLPAANMVPSSSSPQTPKKSMAATLVESSKKKSVALVPKEISKLAMRFFPLFNPSLFPHRPPPVAVANRVLFTDAEDGLLALGMMEYNTDWKAIQQRFLPCKSKHQIFVRQKNRCSSKAPENPIKAVRRMKTSPLTAKEIECIQEGLKIFKLDWMSVWKFVVPHRDPTLLRRQWRIAQGTQRCYKQDAAKKEKRRLYELKRRCKTADLANWHLDSDKEGENTVGENNSGDDYGENADDGCVHEAFLADWRQGASNHSRDSTLLREGTHIREKPNDGSGESQPPTTNMHGLPCASNYSQHTYPLSHFTPVRHFGSNSMQTNHPISHMSSKASKSKVYLPPYRAHRTNNAQLVKLAPDLPPVNLPPSVRIISKSAFKGDRCGAFTKVSGSGGGVGDSGQGNAVPLIPHVGNLGTPCSINTGKAKRVPVKEIVTNSRPEESSFVKDKFVEKERGTESDLQMHPLLFQAPEDGRLPYYPLNCSTSTSGAFSFFSGSQPRLNLSLFHNPQVNNVVDCLKRSLKTKESISESCGIDFHPLLKRTEVEDSDSMTAPSTAHISDAGRNKSLVNANPSAAGTVPSSPNEKANELDLEIHLSSTSTKEKAAESRGVTAHNPKLSTTGVTNPGVTLGFQNSNTIHYPYGDSCMNLVPNASVSVAPSTSNIDDIGDHSHPEIVMEQEELSDSDEEVEEHVEFECEEMADSEGEEGSGCEHVAEMQDKEAWSLETEVAATDGDKDDRQCELRTQGSVRVPRKGSSSFLKLDSINLGEDTNSSWLSLNSCTSGPPPRPKSNDEEDTIRESQNKACSRPKRSCKKTTTSTKKPGAQKHTVNEAQQLSLGPPHVVKSVRKPRKPASRINTSSSNGTDCRKHQI